MVLTLVFGVLLLIAVLLSERARTTLLSTAVMFAGTGLVLGSSGLGWLEVERWQEVLRGSAEIALFTVLFVDGTQLDAREIGRAWRLPGRALLVGLPLTIGVISVGARLVLGLTWVESLLLGAVLSPTDPVMVRTILEHDGVPQRLRHLLAVESGLNDGLALPPIIILLAVLGAPDAHPLLGVAEAAGGIVVGVVIGSLAYAERARAAAVAEAYRPLLGIALACMVFAVCQLTGANELLAAYVAGVMFTTARPELAHAFKQVGEPMSEAVKLGALLVFGATLTLSLELPVMVFAVIALLVARPLALMAALFAGGLSRAEWLAAAWFGPKGFASILYGVLVLASGIPHAHRLYEIIGWVVLLSVFAHASTDSVIARRFRTPT